ncbi:MAG: amidohydrolase [Tissierellia bacterium]|nr:amidohydrolase [Tissierellia bacterium]
MNIWIKNATVLTMDDKQMILENTNLYVEGNRILHIGEELRDFVAEKVIDANKKVVMPGLINCHTHIAMSVFRNYGNDVGLETWLQDYIWPAESNLTPEDVRIGSEVSIAEMIESGTTTFVDMYYYMDEVAKASEKMGIRAVLTRGMTNPTKEILEGEREFYRNWHGKANGRIEMMVGSHSVYTNNKESLIKERDLADELKVGIHIHLNESQSEVENSIKDHKLAPLEFVDTLGMLNKKTIAAHCVWLSDREKEIAIERQINMVHNPASNMKLASGFMEAQKMINAGANVCLGTDGSASNNVLDMFEEMKLASLIAKGRYLDPQNLDAKTVLKMATVNGAKAIGKEGQLGKLKEGYLADLIIIDFDNLRHVPNNDIMAALVYSTNGFDVNTTIIDGNVLYENNEHIGVDVELLKEEVNNIFNRLVR